MPTGKFEEANNLGLWIKVSNWEPELGLPFLTEYMIKKKNLGLNSMLNYNIKTENLRNISLVINWITGVHCSYL
jgi:hypothetical protein